jgi:hypothetical protein
VTHSTWMIKKRNWMNINNNIEEGYVQTRVAPWGTSLGYRNACAKVCIDQEGALL